MREIKWILQKLFTKAHVSDFDLWGLYIYLTPIIYYKLRAFRDKKRLGYPCSFENMEQWDACLDEMLFAFEFIMSKENIKNENEFKKKYGDWEARIKKNKMEPILPGWDYYYFDKEMHEEFCRRQQNGLELFGKHFMSLWD